MAFPRRRSEAPQTGVKWLEVDASMTGTLAFKDPVNLQINGRFEGKLQTKGHLAIGSRAQVLADIEGEAMTIGGTVTGTLSATSRIELLAEARVQGKIISPRVIMHEGAVMQGSLEMITEGREPPWMSVEDLARYLEVDPATIIEWAQRGRLPAESAEGTWRFERAKIEEWLAHEKIKSS